MASKWMAGLGLALVCLNSQAVVRSGVWVGAPSLQLYDLDPHDSYRPSLLQGGPSLDVFDDVLGPAPISSETIGEAFVHEGESSIVGKANGPGSSFEAVADRYAPSFSFTLSPYSGVEIRAPYRLSVFSDESRRDVSAGGSATFEMTVLAVNDIRYDPEYDSWDYSILHNSTQRDEITGENNGLVVGWHQRNGAMTFSIQNDSATDAVFAYRAELVAWGFSPVAPVPEPGTIGLMLAGLSGVGWYARRRARHQARASAQIVRAQFQA